MKFPWKRIADAKAQTAEEQAKAAAAHEQVEGAKAEYEKTLRTGFTVSAALSALFYHAEQNQIIENIQKVARGH